MNRQWYRLEQIGGRIAEAMGAMPIGAPRVNDRALIPFWKRSRAIECTGFRCRPSRPFWS